VVPQFAAASLMQQAPGASIPMMQRAVDPGMAQKVRESLLQYISSNPKAAFAIEQISAAAGGAGFRAAEEAGAGPMGQMAGGLAGGMAPGIAVEASGKSLSGMAFKAMRRVLNKEQFEAHIRRDLGKAFVTGMD
jgi:hypothetical protein